MKINHPEQILKGLFFTCKIVKTTNDFFLCDKKHVYPDWACVWCPLNSFSISQKKILKKILSGF